MGETLKTLSAPLFRRKERGEFKHPAACSASMLHRTTLGTNGENLVGVGVTLSGVRDPKVGKKIFVGIGDPKKIVLRQTAFFGVPMA
jgi:hypothetical protein